MCQKEKNKKYNDCYIEIAESVAKLSYGERSKVGCIIVSKDGQIISHGWNGMPTGFDNCCEHIEDGNLITNKEVLHAESNAIAKCAKYGNGSTKDASLYVTLSPCLECAKLIIQSGISTVYFREKYRKTEGIDLLKKVGISVIQI